jgi:hypothetical protein
MQSPVVKQKYYSKKRITPETLVARGWVKKRHVWIKGKAILVLYCGKWILWKNGKQREVTKL